MEKKGTAAGSTKETDTKYSTTIRENKDSTEGGRSDEESKSEQMDESLTNISTARPTYENEFLNQDDYTEDEINKYKESLKHNDKELEERFKNIWERKEKLNVVMIAEKPKIAELISQVLSKNKAK